MFVDFLQKRKVQMNQTDKIWIDLNFFLDVEKWKDVYCRWTKNNTAQNVNIYNLKNDMLGFTTIIYNLLFYVYFNT